MWIRVRNKILKKCLSGSLTRWRASEMFFLNSYIFHWHMNSFVSASTCWYGYIVNMEIKHHHLIVHVLYVIQIWKAFHLSARALMILINICIYILNKKIAFNHTVIQTQIDCFNLLSGSVPLQLTKADLINPCNIPLDLGVTVYMCGWRIEFWGSDRMCLLPDT